MLHETYSKGHEYCRSFRNETWQICIGPDILYVVELTVRVSLPKITFLYQTDHVSNWGSPNPDLKALLSGNLANRPATQPHSQKPINTKALIVSGKMGPAFVSPTLSCALHSRFTPLQSLTSLRRSGAAVVRARGRHGVRMVVEAGGGDTASEVAGSDGSGESFPVSLSNEALSAESGANIGDDGDDVVVLEELKPPQFYLNAQAISEARLKFKRHETDTGSPEYQIASLTTRIAYLTDHLKKNPKDHASTRGLLQMVAKRTKLLKFLKRTSTDRFHNIIEGLNIRISQQLRNL